jgi:hypothetical protein
MGKDNGFREGKKQETLEKIRASLTEEELHRLDEMKKLDSVKPGSISYKLAVHEDQLRVNLKKEKFNIKKIMWNIRNAKDQIERARFQLSSGDITETIGNSGIIMNQDELTTHIKYMEWTQLGEIQGITPILLRIRGIVGHIDVERKVIMEEKEFDKYVQEIEAEVKELGFDIFQ